MEPQGATGGAGFPGAKLWGAAGAHLAAGQIQDAGAIALPAALD